MGRLALNSFERRDAAQTRSRDGRATRCQESPLFLSDLLTGHDPGGASVLASQSDAWPWLASTLAPPVLFMGSSTVRKPRIGTMNPVGQPFQAAGSAGFPARRTNWGLESPQTRRQESLPYRAKVHGKAQRFANCAWKP